MNRLTEDNLSGINHEGPATNRPLKYLTATSIIGDHVHNLEDEHIGTIKNIMIDIETGKIDYYIIEFGGFFGISTKYYAIPFGLLNVDEKKQLFVFNQKKETLELAPGFDMEHWPDTNIHWDKVYDYWSFYSFPFLF